MTKYVAHEGVICNISSVVILILPGKNHKGGYRGAQL